MRSEPTTTENAPPPPQRLDYAPGRSLVGRIGRRRLIWIGVVVAVAIAINNWAYPVMERVRRWNAERAYRQLQKACLAYAAPADRVVYEEEPVEAAALLARDAAYAPIEVVDANYTRTGRPGWQPPVTFTEQLWTRYAGGVRPVMPPRRSIAYMGERTTPSGARRLVCVEVGVVAQQGADGRWGINRWLQAWSFRIGSIDSAAQTAPMGQMIITNEAPRPAGGIEPLTDDPAKPFHPPFPLRLYAGQPDPGDRSRFAIPYALSGQRGTISAVLQDDGHVLLTPDIGWHGRLGTTVSWTPKLPRPSTTAPAATTSSR